MDVHSTSCDGDGRLLQGLSALEIILWPLNQMSLALLKPDERVSCNAPVFMPAQTAVCNLLHHTNSGKSVGDRGHVR